MASRRRGSVDSGESNEEDSDEEVEFSQAGSIKRLKFFNFMQYTEVEFNCGPNLNVIIGKTYFFKNKSNVLSYLAALNIKNKFH